MFYQTPERNKPSFWRRLKWFLLILIVMAALLAGSAVTYYKNNLRPVGTDTAEITFVVDDGTTFPAVASELYEKQLIRNEQVFNWHLRLNNYGELKAGTYKLSKAMSVSEIVTVITDGKVATDLVIILPGKRIDQIKAELVRAGFNEAEVEAGLEPSLYGSHPVFEGMNLPANLEGFIYPEGYVIASGTTVEEIIGLALDETSKALSSELRAGLEKQGLTIYEALVLGSVIEREVSTKSAEDQARVAQVFLKRYREGIALQSDPTAVYGAVLDGVVNDDTTMSDMIAHASPYNTYKQPGLPPTPISNVSASSLAALANPATSDYLYFVAGRDCVTRFGRTISEHEANIARHGVATSDSGCR